MYALFRFHQTVCFLFHQFFTGYTPPVNPLSYHYSHHAVQLVRLVTDMDPLQSAYHVYMRC